MTATASITKGEVVLVYGGALVPKSEILGYRKLMGHIGAQMDDNFFLVPTSHEEIEKTGAPNHGCEPNLGFDGTLKLVAIRDIQKGEELLLDYAFMESFFEPFACKCGAKTCRGTITPDDWKNLELQKKYGPYFSPYLQKKFAKA